MPVNSISSGPLNTSTFNDMPFDENLFTCQCEKKTKTKAEGFQISHFYWSFSSEIMAVKRSGIRLCEL